MIIIGEIGINHNGEMDIAKRLIDIAALAGCDAVKFQKRTLSMVYTEEFLDSPRISPWGDTQRAQKEGLEFNAEQYHEIDAHCRTRGIHWLASAWDIESQRFLQQFDLRFNKIASAMLTNEPLISMIAEEGRYTFISTGMSTMEEIEDAVTIFRQAQCPFELMHCNSTYPMKPEDANLLMIPALRERFRCKVGYSGHELDPFVSLYAAVLGATSLERHITLDRSMYGSDQGSSLEPDELFALVKQVRRIGGMLGSGEKVLTEAETEVRRKLRG